MKNFKSILVSLITAVLATGCMTIPAIVGIAQSDTFVDGFNINHYD